ncbi:alkaline phosphatase family protein [Polymorphobacter glacialis]|uniref:Alkaline phosphatase family protein n=2 Tax=Sandarakinorhabdus glacialis TaxID=1614636 RepID=A0A916ZIE5_9SPHN|nr:alkaline phosphatase family protein [Polymorphobacter glacialis]
MVLALVLAGCATPRAEVARPVVRPPLILVSIDGMRADYLARGVTPNLKALAARGVTTTAMRPSFPSVTFPNHYTIVTGKRPDRNGIVNNSMEDPAIPGVRFSMGNRDAVTDRRWWDQAEPVWVTAEKAGIRTAPMFWPGSEAAVHGVRPSEWAVFDSKLSGDARVDRLLASIDAPMRPGFLTLYLETVDHEGHMFGPDAPETVRAVAGVDAEIGRLLAGLKGRGIEANIIVLADHGMAATGPERVILLDAVAPAASFRLVTGGAVAGIAEVPGQEAALAAGLLRPHPHMQCWRKGAIPARLHYGANSRVPAIVCMAEAGWLILGTTPKTPVTVGGMHGYDPAAPEMAAMFVAAGPGFREGVTVGAFDNVDVYPVMMKLLGVKAVDGDGDGGEELVKGALR